MPFGQLLSVLACSVALAACDSDPTTAPDPADEMRAATAAYADVDAAVAAGFVPLSECVVGPAGGMGFHYGMPPRLEDAVVDLTQPEVLLYAPDANGDLRLVGVEFMMHQDAWAAAGHTGAPEVAGQTFADPNPQHPDPMVRPFYTLHAWVWQENPTGMFAPFNPTVSCG